MNRIALGAFLLTLWAVQPALAAPKDSETKDADDTQDVLYVGKPHPVLVRLHLRIDGKSAFAQWDNYLERFFKHLDRNNSGSLDRIEANKVPSTQQMLQFFQGNLYIYFNPRAKLGTRQVNFEDLDKDRDGKVTLEEFKDFYLRGGAGPVQLQARAAFYNPGGTDSLTDIVFDLLDTNRDGKLSRKELESAPQVLMRYDNDDNELVSQAELGIAGNRSAQYRLAAAQQALIAGQRRPTAGQSNLILVARDDGRRAAGKLAIARDILARYDKDKDGKLSREEIGFSKKLFDQLDRNKDGKLNVLELVRWVKEKPAGEFTVRLRGSGTMMARRPAMKAKPGARLDDMSVTLDGVQINVVPQATLPNYANTMALENLFEQADDNKGFVTRKQLDNQQYVYLRGLFDLADRNNDGRMSKQELKSCLSLLSAARGGQITLSLVATGQGLFQALDANGDGQLSVRELRNSWKRLQSYDRDKDGCVSRSEFPYQFQLTVNRSAYGNVGVRTVVRGGMGNPARLPMRGPLWFRKMDRNGDGDVSRTEWLGTGKRFDEIDADKDGLISADEAEAYDAAVRKK